MKRNFQGIGILFFAASMGFACYAFAKGDEEISKKTSERLLQDLSSEDPNRRSGAHVQFVRRRRQIIHSLQALAANEQPEGHLKFVKHKAIDLLGHYRIAEAANLLVKQIGYSPPVIYYSEDSPWTKYPAAIALREIGAPAIRAIIGRLIHPVSDKELKLFSFVIMSVERNRMVGLYRLKLELEEAQRTRSGRSANLRRLIKMYESIDLRNSDDWP